MTAKRTVVYHYMTTATHALEQWWLYECGQCGYTSTEQGEPVEDICPDCEEETITPIETEEAE